MGEAENAAWPDEQSGDDNVVSFGQSKPEQPHSIDEFDEVILKGLFNEDNAQFILAVMRETGDDLRVILDEIAESYAGFYEIWKRRYPIYYITPDGKSHKLHDGFDEDEPQAS